MVKLRRTLHDIAGPRRPTDTGPAAWLLEHSHRAFWVGRWAQLLGSGLWISATALF